jgi:hypothetical protein
VTVLVGIVCDDGVVIGADTVETFGNAVGFRTIEQPNAVKLRVIGSTVLTATTGAVGLAQRFNEIMKGLNNTSKLNMAKVMEQGTFISQTVIEDFKKTISMMQHQPAQGWGLGALVAMPVGARAELFEFDPIQFHPERRGDPDEKGRDRTSRIVSMGSGQPIADPFLGFIRRVFWTSDKPKVRDARLAVTWTLMQTIHLNTGGVGGVPHLATLEKVDGKWVASELEADEIVEQVAALEKHIGKYRDELFDKSARPAEPAPSKT